MNTTCLADTPSTRARARCSWNAEERVQWITLLEQSGQSLSEFCRANDLPESTVSLWRKQLRGAPSVPSDTGALLEVPITALAPPRMSDHVPARAATVIIHLPGEIDLEATAGTDVAWLAELIRTLRS